MKLLITLVILVNTFTNAQVLNHKKEFTRQDSLRGTNNEFRNWWDVQFYKLFIEPDFDKKSIKGYCTIEFKVVKNTHENIMQIDLQEPMTIENITLGNHKIKDFQKEGNVYFIKINKSLEINTNHYLTIHFSGNPRLAVRPPWDGGWVFTKDEKGRDWASVACQGLGASVWFPNKDYQGDEPDRGMDLVLRVPKGLNAVANGRLVERYIVGEKEEFVWVVENPINNYNIIPYIGSYVNFNDVYEGEKGKLDLNYWVLDYNLEKAKKQFEQVKPMLKSFEHWFGAYPFYKDGYKLVESPYLGMEHQSAIAYGNHYVNGYMGNDLSQTGWGLKWDFIIIHESGHEWFGNSITTKDVADMWVHESFTAYSETLYTEDLYGKEAGNDYVIGARLNILNDIPMIGNYGVNQEGSGDIYYKGANMLHTFRQLLEDDDKFRSILRGLNETFYHKTVTTKEIEDFLSEKSGIDLTEFFNQYLRTIMIPILEYKLEGNQLSYRWTNIVERFDMPVKIADSEKWIFPTYKWKTETLTDGLEKNFQIDRNFYIQTIKRD
ncbi:MAG: M1 family metallopeptidase [Moheibacter sp.]